jgi:hypothetical protein
MQEGRDATVSLKDAISVVGTFEVREPHEVLPRSQRHFQ